MSAVQTIKYIWVDEDGEQMSPTHGTIGAALRFGSGWQTRRDRVSYHAGIDMSAADQRRQERGQRAMQRTSTTGKPPVELKRVVITEEVQPCTNREIELAVAVLGFDLPEPDYLEGT